jgi:RimJ/RimL family protein N-acetyltransferase
MANVADVALRDVTDADVDVFFEHQLDPEASAMANFSSRDAAAHRAHWDKIRADRSVVTKTIVADGDVAGNIVSWVTDEGRREIGYWIGKHHWGKGIATAAVALFLELESERPLYAGVAEHNFGSIRVLEKCGFRPSGDHPPAAPHEVRYVELELRD